MIESSKELLELAAKAAGVDARRIGTVINGERDQFWLADPEVWVEAWNPLTDDADAFRLAVKLHIHIEFSRPMKAPAPDRLQASPWGAGHLAEVVEFDGDPYAATRLAIVRAAAAIGKEMP